MAWLLFLICLETALSVVMNLRHAVYLGKSRTRLPGVLCSELAQVKGKDEPNPDCPCLRGTASIHNLTLHPSVAERNPEESGWQQSELLEGCQTAAGLPAIPSSGRWEVSLLQSLLSFKSQNLIAHILLPPKALLRSPSHRMSCPPFFLFWQRLCQSIQWLKYLCYIIYLKTQLPSLLQHLPFPEITGGALLKGTGWRVELKTQGHACVPRGVLLPLIQSCDHTSSS